MPSYLPEVVVGKAYLSALLVCDSAVADPSGKLTLYGIFNNLQAPSFPTVHPQMAIYFSCFLDEPSRIGVAMHNEAGECIFKSEGFDVSPDSKPAQAHGIYNLIGFKFDGPGSYKLSLTANEIEVGSAFFSVTQLENAK